jgi:UDP-N-acetylglucosamine 2-epimerase
MFGSKYLCAQIVCVEKAKQKLLKKMINRYFVLITGNTVINTNL